MVHAKKQTDKENKTLTNKQTKMITRLFFTADLCQKCFRIIENTANVLDESV